VRIRPTRTPLPLPAQSVDPNDDDKHVLLIGRPVTEALASLAEAQIKEGPVFRRIDQWATSTGCADAAIGQPDPEAPLPAGGARCCAVFGPWLEVGVSDRGCQPRHPAARGNAAVAAQIGDAER